MFKFNQLKSLELEISNNCQASCPMCPRNIHGGLPNQYLQLNDWTIDDFKTIVNNEVLSTIESILFCGSFGDPIMNQDFQEMIKYVKQNKPELVIKIHTNGSLRSTKWWKEFAEILPDNHEVFFALDGTTQETHSLYRVGTNYNKIIENANSFISAGGKATWSFLRFKHNQNEVDLARELSVKMGFVRFTIKDTRRFESEQHVVLDKNGRVTHVLELPEQNLNGVVNMFHISKTKESWENTEEISCYALESKSVYINANKIVVPCCIKGSFIDMDFDSELFSQYNLSHEYSVNPLGYKIKKEEFDIIEQLGGFKQLDATLRPLTDIVGSETWQTLWHEHWKNKSSTSCKLMCSKKSPYILINEQKAEDTLNVN